MNVCCSFEAHTWFPEIGVWQCGGGAGDLLCKEGHICLRGDYI